MAQLEAKFDRMVRVRGEIYQMASVASAFEQKTLKEFVEEALREKLATVQQPAHLSFPTAHPEPAATT